MLGFRKQEGFHKTSDWAILLIGKNYQARAKRHIQVFNRLEADSIIFSITGIKLRINEKAPRPLPFVNYKLDLPQKIISRLIVLADTALTNSIMQFKMRLSYPG